MTTIHFMFYIFAAIAVGSAVSVITVYNPVNSVLSLVVTFFAMAGIWMILHAEFLSLILLLVYVGAVMTLFLFVVMMLNIDLEQKRVGFVRYFPLGLGMIIALVGLIISVEGPENFGLQRMPVPVEQAVNYSNTKGLGEVLYTLYAYPFEIAGVLLLAAIIAAITLTHRGPKKRRVQSIAKQVSANPKDRVRLIKMPPETKETKETKEATKETKKDDKGNKV